MLKPRRYKIVVSAGTPAPSGDPYWTSVSLLTNFENNLTFQDGSTNNFAITRNGTVNPSLNTPFSGVGGSEYFNGSTGYFTVPLNAALNVGTGDFTFECWVYFNALTLGNIFDGAVNGIAVALNPSSQLSLGQSNVAYLVADTAAATTGSWFHVVGVRSGTTLSLFKNGTRVATATNSTNFSTTVANRIGWNGVAAYFNGFLSNLRIVKGTAVYDPTLTTLTVPTAPLTAITNTSLLITGTGQGMFDNATFVDQGPNALTVTATGAPVYSGLSPFGNTYAGSVLLNGTSAYLSAPSNTALQFGTGDFTIEMWWYSQTLATAQPLIYHTDDASITGTGEYAVVYNTSLGMRFYLNAGAAGTVSQGSTAGWTTNTWYHVAVVKSGSTLTIYRNGVSIASGSNTATVGAAVPTYIGGEPFDPLYTTGYISNLRIVKGTAVYTANFTPSTTPLTAITNTSLLVRGDTGAFYDLSNVGNGMTSTGTTAVTTQVKKYGAESASYTATAYQTVADAVNLQLGSGDYTIEAWVYRNAAGVLHSLICKGAAATGWLQVNSSNQLVFTVTSTAILTSTTTIAATTWTFVTVTRSGSSTRLFVGGNLEATATDSTNFNQTNALLVGSDRSNANGLNGYLDDIRITKGVARYTATFTPPTATFPTA